MPRKPAHLELRGGKGPRQRVWEAIRHLAAASAEPFSEDDIWHATADAAMDIEIGLIHDYRRGLVAAGILADAGMREEDRPNRQRRVRVKVFTLARDTGAEAPRVRRDGTPVTMGLAQEQMWRTLRMLKADVNARELAAHASTPEVPVHEAAAADYLRNLHHANYLGVAKDAARARADGGRVHARYRLISDTGPRPPMVCRANTIYDPNLGAIVWISPVTEEDAIYAR